jgi:hypothetical protein
MLSRSEYARVLKSKGGMYIGVADKWTERYREHHKGHMHMTPGDLRAMPSIPSNYIDHIWITNVFGAPSLPPKVSEKDLAERPELAARFAEVEQQGALGKPLTALSVLFGKEVEIQIFTELSRVLRKGGSICICEIISPEVAYQLLSVDYQSYGFAARIYKTPEQRELFMRRYGINRSLLDDEFKKRAVQNESVWRKPTNQPFFIELTKS